MCLLLSPRCVGPWAGRQILLTFPAKTRPSSGVCNAPYFSNCGPRNAWPTTANAHTDEHSRRGEEERITVTNISPRRRHGRKLGVLVGWGVAGSNRLVNGIKLTSGSWEGSLGYRLSSTRTLPQPHQHRPVILPCWGRAQTPSPWTCASDKGISLR